MSAHEGWSLAGFGVPEHGLDASHMFTGSDEWIDVESGGREMTQADLSWATDIVIQDGDGNYHTMSIWEWDESQLDDLYAYIESWLESEYA